MQDHSDASWWCRFSQSTLPLRGILVWSICKLCGTVLSLVRNVRTWPSAVSFPDSRFCLSATTCQEFGSLHQKPYDIGKHIIWYNMSKYRFKFWHVNKGGLPESVYYLETAAFKSHADTAFILNPPTTVVFKFYASRPSESGLCFDFLEYQVCQGQSLPPDLFVVTLLYSAWNCRWPHHSGWSFEACCRWCRKHATSCTLA